MNLLGDKAGQSNLLSMGKLNELTRITAGLGWDAKMLGDADLDAAALKVYGDFRQPHTLRAVNPSLQQSLVFHRNPQLPGMRLLGDDRTGHGSGPDEEIVVDLNQIDSDGVLFSVNIHGGDAKNQEFDEVRNVFFQVVDQSGRVLVRRDVDDELRGMRSGFIGGVFRDHQSGCWVSQYLTLPSRNELGNGLLQQLGITH